MFTQSQTLQPVSSPAVRRGLLPGALACVLLTAAAGAEEVLVRTADDSGLQWAPCPEFMPEGCRLAVLQGDPAQPNADVFFRLPGGTTAPHHLHTSAERMVLVAGELIVHYEGQDPVTLLPGTYAYGPPELPHTAECTSAEACVLFIAFEEPVNAIPVEQ